LLHLSPSACTRSPTNSSVSPMSRYLTLSASVSLSLTPDTALPYAIALPLSPSVVMCTRQACPLSLLLCSSPLLSSPLLSYALLCPPLLSSLLLSSPLFSAQLNDTLSLICLFFTTFFSLICLFFTLSMHE